MTGGLGGIARPARLPYRRRMRIFQVDAFTEVPFRGNPAAVCPLEQPRDDAWMQQVAAEMNLSETAFVWPENDRFRLRWFTPLVEVPLCGHATLATTHVLHELGLVENEVVYDTRSGLLRARRHRDGYELDFPAIRGEPCEAPAPIAAAVAADHQAIRLPREGMGEDNYLFELADESAVRTLQPDFAALRDHAAGVIVTARANPGQPHDFVSRYFVPAAGIDEDPVTGSAHCALAPYWADKLGRTELTGYQASRRGGTVAVHLTGDRVLLRGNAVTVLDGTLRV